MAASVGRPHLNGVVPFPFSGSHFNNNLPTTFSDDGEDSEFRSIVDNSNAGLQLQPSINDPRDESTADNWVLRNPSLIRLTGKHPFNSEPPLSLLMQHGFITPVQLHYVRNHGPVPKATWTGWTVEVTGLVKKPTRFTMDRLVSEFPTIEFPATLVCAGNRRMEHNMVKQTIGFNWGAGAISNSVWRGVPLRHVLKACGIMSSKRGALNVCFEGAEDLPGGGGGSKYGTSIKKEVAIDPARDVILAYMQNGELLSPDHGFPVRVIIPGFIGGRMIKWLKRIMVTTMESDSYYHYKDNKVLPSHVDAELANSQAWWYKPEYMITELNVNSAITTPCHEEMLPINTRSTQLPYTFRGYAYSGGGRKIMRVEVTLDEGETWRVCQLDVQEKGSRYGKYWCWCFWSLEVEVLHLLGAKKIAVRAWDEGHNTQPDKVIWNVMGMMNNCWFRVKTNICKPLEGEVGILFEHPTKPGPKPGGWMVRECHLNVSDPTHIKRTTSTPIMNRHTNSSKLISMSELQSHNSAESAWIAVHDHVYDATRFLKDHPGGPDSILLNAGTDCTEEFDAIHSDSATNLLEGFRIGELITPNSPEFANIPGSRDNIPCKLIDKVSLSRDVRRFRFELLKKDQVLGLPVGKHIFLCATIKNSLCMRPYTPTSTVDVIGYFDLVVKIYSNGGVMSKYIDSLSLGSILEVKGPLGHIEYTGLGKFTAHGKPKSAKKLAMIAGGTGITPIYQVMQAILKNPEDETEIFLVYANRTVDDILLRDELDKWTDEFRSRVKVWYVVQESTEESWQYDVGFVTEKLLMDHMPGPGEDVLALACGPPSMIQFAVRPNLEKMGYNVKEQLLVF